MEQRTILTQPGITGWTTGNVTLNGFGGGQNIIRITTNVNGLGPVTWWRYLYPSETFRRAAINFYTLFPFAAMGTNCASCVADLFSPAGRTLLDSQEFSFDCDHLNIFNVE